MHLSCPFLNEYMNIFRLSFSFQSPKWIININFFRKVVINKLLSRNNNIQMLQRYSNFYLFRSYFRRNRNIHVQFGQSLSPSIFISCSTVSNWSGASVLFFFFIFVWGLWLDGWNFDFFLNWFNNLWGWIGLILLLLKFFLGLSGFSLFLLLFLLFFIVSILNQLLSEVCTNCFLSLFFYLLFYLDLQKSRFFFSKIRKPLWKIHQFLD